MLLAQVVISAIACLAQYVVSSSRRGRVDALALTMLIGLALGTSDSFLDLPPSTMAIAVFLYVVLAFVMFRRRLVDLGRLEREVAYLEGDQRRTRS